MIRAVLYNCSVWMQSFVGKIPLIRPEFNDTPRSRATRYLTELLTAINQFVHLRSQASGN